MPKQMVHVILNPASGGGRAGRLRAEIDAALRARGVDVLLHETRASGHARELAQLAVNAGAEIVAAAGGDGTLHEVANGLLCAGTKVPMAVIPIGTGNDFAKVVPGAHTRESAYDIIAHGQTHLFDAGLATWHGGREYFINAMGTGIDVEVVRQILRLPALPGPIKYLLGLLRALAVYKPVTLRATLPHEVIERTVMMFAVGNGVCQGGGFFLTPHARADDRVLELCVVQQIPMWQVPFVLPLVLRGTHAGHAAVTMRSFEQIRFESVDGRPLFFQLDGELREPPDAGWLDVEIRPAVLPVVVRG
ncbi:MAG TPA: diacylglycerol kinase family protein [Longimicrobiales bacterium]|nr:diacylglycerol kinase family protein [Longimicrobiales bacterium]